MGLALPNLRFEGSAQQRALIDEKVAVLIAGPCGTGKSHLAQALGHCAVRHGCDVLFTTQSQLLGALHAARATQATSASSRPSSASTS